MHKIVCLYELNYRFCCKHFNQPNESHAYTKFSEKVI
jgi:hypothetical protein